MTQTFSRLLMLSFFTSTALMAAPLKSAPLAPYQEQLNCLKNLDVNWPSKAGTTGIELTEVPTLPDVSPRGLYLIGPHRSYLVPTSQSMELTFKNEETGKDVVRFVKTKSALSRALESTVTTATDSCTTREACGFKNQLVLKVEYAKSVVGNSEAVKAMNGYIKKTIAGSAKRFMEEKTAQLLKSSPHPEVISGRLQGFVSSLQLGLEACLKAQPELQKEIAAETKWLKEFETQNSNNLATGH